MGKQLGKYDLKELRKTIAWVSPFIQQHLDSSLTGLDMVLSGPDGYLGFYRKASDEELSEAHELLKMLNAEHLAEKSILGMSSGEQMKILIARMLASKPELMIFDEPCVFLDMKEREVLLNAIENLAKNNSELTVIFISQRIEDILPMFDKGMILKSGEIVVCDKRENVLTKENIKKAFDLDVELLSNKNGRMWAITK